MPSISTNAAVAARLVQTRLSAGCTTCHAGAILLGMNPETYAQHERGEAALKPAELRRCAETFSVSHAWLLTGIGAGPKVS